MPSWYPSEINPVLAIFIEEQAVAISKICDLLVFYNPVLTRPNLLSGQMFLKDYNFSTQSNLKILRKKIWIPQKIQALFYPIYYSFVRSQYQTYILRKWGRPDLIHAQAIIPAGWASSKLGREEKIPVIVTEHYGSFANLLRTKASRKIIRETLHNVEKVVAVSPALAKVIKDFDPSVEIKVR